jgi:adenine-specific DNA-methyltransferase
MTITEIRNILETPYDRKVWKRFLQTQFTNNKLNAEDRVIVLSDKSLSKQCLSLGNYEINEYINIGIFEVELNEKVNIARNRVALRNLIKDITKQVAGAMVVFVQGEKWRFSYISKRKVKNAATNEIEDKQTAPKRYTYLFGKNEKALTAAIRFDKLIQKQKENIFQFLSIDDFEEAFSVEKLSKEFFKNYKEIYEDFVQFLTGKRYGKKGNKYVEQVIHEPNWQLTSLFDKDQKAARDFCKRLMGRIVFLYFIQKKGWLAVGKGKKWGEGNPDYLYDLFRKSKNKDDFYARELVPLFFTRLNNEDSENKARDERFPYLNGGLFDDSHDRKYNKLFLPEEIFERLFTIFNNYNFTVYEDAPDEHTVAVDPEMLGHIFENLLEDNKDKGAFYTPKEIVHYMCKESLKAYLYAQDDIHIDDNNIGKAAIYKIIQQQELAHDEKQFAEKNAYKIIDALESVKICDPAIGSGAFPMGMLQEIFNAQIYLQELKGFKKGVTDADIKKHIIEESIYGVDIDAGAVDIARLRFWLSLVVDEQEPQPLPNLDFKIVCANTLIPLGKVSGNDMEEKASLAVKELEKIRHEFFDVSSEDKLKIERQFKKVQTDLLSLRELTTKENYEIYTKLYEFNPFEDKTCSWFDPWWMFGIKEGFDIVIGNPPYVQLQKLNGKLAKQLEQFGYRTFERTGDIYCIFYEKGMQMLKEKGVLCMITSSQWMKANYGRPLRKLFLEKNPLKLIALGPSVFESATVDTNVMIVQNTPNAIQLEGAIVTNSEQLENVSTVGLIPMPYVTADSWAILNSGKQEIKRVLQERGKALIDWDIEIFRGIVTGYNEAFIIKEAKRKELIEADSKNDNIIKPILRGREIKKYVSDWENDYVVFIPWHFPLQEDTGIVGSSKKAEIEFSKTYNALYKYLEGYKEDLSNRNKDETGIRYEWYALQRCAATYKEEFSKEKIIWKNVGSKVRFSYSDQEVYGLDTTCIATGEKIKYLTGLLNSKVCQYQLFESAPRTGTGDLKASVQALEPIRVYYPNDQEQKQIETITDYLICLHRKSTDQIISHTTNDRVATHFENVLNMMVYELYFEQHMKEVGIDVLQFVKKKQEEIKYKIIEEQIREFYLWYQKPENPVRQRMQLIETRSPDIIALIDKSLQQ